MSKNTRTHKNSFWKGIPDELRFMCLAEVRGTGHYCTEPILRFLSDHMYDCDSFIFGATPYDVIRWIDTAVEMCLFPLEWHEDDWIKHKKVIRMVLERFEVLLQKVAPADYKEGYRTSYNSRHGISIVEYAQKLNVYFSVLYMYTEEWEKLRERLNQLLISTENNVRHMLSYEEAEEYASMDDWAEFHYIGTDMWEPLNWLYRETLPFGNARKLFEKTYEAYVAFLEDLEKGEHLSEACSRLRVKAEERLGHIHSRLIGEED